jgi:tRNA A-37 threonylcarbamoyl transferase component Bud32
MEDLTGMQLGPYRILRPLGEGGMAAVFAAYQPSMERTVAIKVLPRQYAQEPVFLARFRQEATLVANLQHPNILPVFDFGESQGYTYLVMPFIQGGTLASRLQGQPLPLEQVVEIIRQVGGALDYAHKKGLVHRDVKPANVLLDEGGNCLLSDFGIARMVETSVHLTTTGGLVGTPAYMAPEQGLGKKADARTDIYALGIVLYQLVTGRVPFRAETPIAVIRMHIDDPLPLPRQLNPGLPEAVERVILRALAKDPAERYSSAAEMVRALQQAAAPAAPATFRAPPPLRVRLGRGGAAVATPTVRSAPLSRPPSYPYPPPVALGAPATTPLPLPPGAIAAARRSRKKGWIIGGAVVALVVLVAGLLSLAQAWPGAQPAPSASPAVSFPAPATGQPTGASPAAASSATSRPENTRTVPLAPTAAPSYTPTAPPTQTPRPKTPQRIVGRVYWTNVPIAGATLLLKQGKSFNDPAPPVAEAVTDDKGAFTLENVPTGSFTLYAVSPSDEYWPWVGQPVTVPAGATLDAGVFYLKKKIVLLEPGENTITETTLTFRWESFPGAALYHLDVFEDISGKTVLRTDTTQTSFTIPQPLTAGTRYQWGVIAKDSSGADIAYTSGRRFVVGR